MKTENKYTKQLITNCVLKAVRGSTTPNKPVLRFPQDKFNSSSFFSVFIKIQKKKVEVVFRWQIGPLQAEGGSYFTHGDGGAPGCGSVMDRPSHLARTPAGETQASCQRVQVGPRVNWVCRLPLGLAIHQVQARPCTPQWLPAHP